MFNLKVKRTKTEVTVTLLNQHKYFYVNTPLINELNWPKNAAQKTVSLTEWPNFRKLINENKLVFIKGKNRKRVNQTKKISEPIINVNSVLNTQYNKFVESVDTRRPELMKQQGDETYYYYPEDTGLDYLKYTSYGLAINTKQFIKTSYARKKQIRDKFTKGKVTVNIARNRAVKPPKIPKNASIHYQGDILIEVARQLGLKWDTANRLVHWGISLLSHEGYTNIDVSANRITKGKQQQKFSKALINLTKIYPYLGVLFNEQFIQKLSTYIQQTKVGSKMKTEIILTTSPDHFLRQSDGVNWSSCHQIIPKTDYAKENGIKRTAYTKHPWLAQALDESTFYAFVKHPTKKAWIARRAIYYNKKQNALYIGRAYPGETPETKAIGAFFKTNYPDMNISDYLDSRSHFKSSFVWGDTGFHSNPYHDMSSSVVDWNYTGAKAVVNTPAKNLINIRKVKLW